MDENKIVFLEGKRLFLRPLNKETDLEVSRRWINDQTVTQYLTAYLPTTKQDEEEWFDNIKERKDSINLAIETKKGVFIGITSLNQIDWKDRVAFHGIVIGEKDYWGKRYGTESHLLLLDYAFSELNLRKICSQAIDYNQRSIKYHLTCGYQIEGRQRKQVYKKGQYWDLVFLGVFKQEWMMALEKHKK